jgi:hypothetical protein
MLTYADVQKKGTGDPRIKEKARHLLRHSLAVDVLCDCLHRPQHPPAHHLRMRQHTSAYVSIRTHSLAADVLCDCLHRPQRPPAHLLPLNMPPAPLKRRVCTLQVQGLRPKGVLEKSV